MWDTIYQAWRRKYKFIDSFELFKIFYLCTNSYLLRVVCSVYVCSFSLWRASSEDWLLVLLLTNTYIYQLFSFYIFRCNIKTPTRHVMEIILVAAEPGTRRKSLGSISITRFWHNSCGVCFSTLHDVISGIVKQLQKSRKFLTEFEKMIFNSGRDLLEYTKCLVKYKAFKFRWVSYSCVSKMLEQICNVSSVHQIKEAPVNIYPEMIGFWVVFHNYIEK